MGVNAPCTVYRGCEGRTFIRARDAARFPHCRRYMDAGDAINPLAALCAGRPRYKSANRTTPIARGSSVTTQCRRYTGSVRASPARPQRRAAGGASHHATRAMQAAGRQRHATTTAAIYTARHPPATPTQRRNPRRRKGGQRPRGGRHHDAKERRSLCRK